MLKSEITSKEYEAMDFYRNQYGSINGDVFITREAPINQCLDIWNTQKDTLYHLLGNKLILTKDFKYETSFAELENEVSDLLYSKEKTYGRENHSGKTFVENFQNWVYKTYGPKYSEEKYNINTLLSARSLAKNEVLFNHVSIDLPNGKTYTIRKGCKTMRALAKIATAFNLEGFEEFRICHSLIMNVQYLNGKLTLSIHPLDYWTMSDNDCDWSSCMSWQNTGEFRQGTVEMMNSPFVINAFLESKTPMEINGLSWSNKKWRQLFIVDEHFIFSIKGYSYPNPSLTKDILLWIAELAKENLGWEYDEGVYGYSGGKFYKGNDLVTCINPTNPLYFQTGLMYLDVSDSSYHYAMVNSKKEFPSRYFTYSGSSQCMHCGMASPHFSHEACLFCNDCEPLETCDHCGNYLDPNEEHFVMYDDTSLCYDCYCESGFFCNCCETNRWNNDAMRFSIILEQTGENTFIIFNEDKTICFDCYQELFEEIPIYTSSAGETYIFLSDLKEYNQSLVWELCDNKWKTSSYLVTTEMRLNLSLAE